MFFFIWVISLTIGKIVPILARVKERTKNFSIIFLHFVDIWTLQSSEWAPDLRPKTSKTLFRPVNFYSFYLDIPYLGLHNAQDFAQILYFAGGVRIIDKNNVFHSFFRLENHMSDIFFYCLSKSSVIVFVLFGHYPTKIIN